MKPEIDTPQPRILIVEDEPVVAMDISGRLTHLGYAVAGTVATGEGAIALAQQTQPDLVLLDIRLRGPMTGIEAAEQIRQRFGYPVVFLTAYAEDDTLKRASQADPLGYVLKPFGDRELKTAIELALYRHQTEKRLRQSEEKFRCYIERAPVAVLVSDVQGQFVDCNPAAVELFGYDVAALRSLKVCDLHPEEDHAAVRQALEALVRCGRVEGDFRMKRRDGTLIWVSLDVGLIGTGLALGYCRDITERKRSEDKASWDAAVTAALSALYAPLISPEASLDSMAQDVLRRAQALTGSGHGFVSTIDLVNHENVALALTGMMQDGSCLIEGKARRIAFPRGADGRYPGLWGEALNTRQAFFSNSLATHPAADGVLSGHVPLQQVLTVPVLLGPQLVGQITLANPGRDYTERDLQAVQRLAEFYALGIQRQRVEESLRQARDAAEAADRLKSEFLANMNHEIRTPMAAILGFSELLAGSDLREPEQRECLQMIQSNGDRLMRLISDILDLSQIEAGQLLLAKSEYTLQHIVDDVLAVVRFQAAEKGLSLQVVRLFPLFETLYTDPVRLRQILVKLVGNAMKFTPRGEVSLTLLALPETGRMQFTVTDTGIGMSAATLARLFQPFTQGDGTHTRIYGGTGLGLAISQRLAKALGGQIEVQSEVGHGSTFTLTLDVGSPPTVSPPPPPPAASAARDVASAKPLALQGRVLLLEDDHSLRLILRHLLSKLNLEVDTANDGRSGCEMAEKSWVEGRPYDLILMDIQMAGMDGFEATRWLRQQGWQGPIVALTAYAMAGDRERCLNAGCDDYLAKPVVTAQLREILTRHLGSVTQA